MSPDQALTASQGKAVSATAAEKQRRAYRKGFVPVRVPHLVADHQLHDTGFQAYLLFDVETAKLVCVDLLPKPGEAMTGALRTTLKNRYGTPAQEERKQLPGVEWSTTVWLNGPDRIELQQGGLGAKLQYCQRDQGQVAAR